MLPHGLTNIRPPRAGSAHLDTVASLAAPAAVPAANPPAMTSLSTSASQPQPLSTNRLMSAQQASSGWDCDSVMACSVAQSAVATVAPTREAAACRLLQAPDASVAAAWTQASEASDGEGRVVRRAMMRAATRRTARQREEDRVVVIIVTIACGEKRRPVFVWRWREALLV